MVWKTILDWSDQNKIFLAAIAGTFFLLLNIILLIYQWPLQKLDLISFVMLLLFIAVIFIALLIVTTIMVKIVLNFGDSWIEKKLIKTCSQLPMVASQLDELLKKVTKTKIADKELQTLIANGEIINMDRLARIEEDIDKGKHIWILTPFLELDRLPVFENAVVDNILEDVCYTYIVPPNLIDEMEDIIKKRVLICKTTGLEA